MISLVATIVVFGFATWLILYIIPMPSILGRLIIGVIVVYLLVLALQTFGVIGGEKLWHVHIKDDVKAPQLKR